MSTAQEHNERVCVCLVCAKTSERPTRVRRPAITATDEKAETERAKERARERERERERWRGDAFKALKGCRFCHRPTAPDVHKRPSVLLRKITLAFTVKQ